MHTAQAPFLNSSMVRNVVMQLGPVQPIRGFETMEQKVYE